MREIAWFSCGVSSAVAAAMSPSAELVRIRIEDEHEDSDRFAFEVSRVLQRKIIELQSPFRSVARVIESQRYVNGPSGAPCTKLLKRRVREHFEATTEIALQVWGFDVHERGRLHRVEELVPTSKHSAPLIDAFMSKAEAHGAFRRLFPGVALPFMYRAGFANNNCLGCVKGSAGYWNRIRREFPAVFAARARLEREIGASCMRGVFLDELDANAGRYEAIEPLCGFSCLLAVNEHGGNA